MHGWVTVAIFAGVIVLLAISWRLRIPTAGRLPWLVWAPDAALLAWGIWALWTKNWSDASLVALILPLWFARTYPLWRARRNEPPDP